MSKLREAYDSQPEDIYDGSWFVRLEAAITEAEETIASLTRERDEVRNKTLDEALASVAVLRYGYEADDYDVKWNQAVDDAKDAILALKTKEPTNG